ATASAAIVKRMATVNNRLAGECETRLTKVNSLGRALSRSACVQTVGKPFTCWDNYTMMKVTWRPPGLGNTAAELRGASEHQLHRVHGEQESEDVRPDADGKGVTHLFDAHGTEVHGEHVERRLGAPLDDGGHQPYLGVGAVAGEKLAHGAQGSRARKRAQQGERKYFPWNAD